jgi:hypothetical protein
MVFNQLLLQLLLQDLLLVVVTLLKRKLSLTLF